MADKREGKIIVRKVVEGGHGGHHGGAWKVAYADFVTAMMAFFLLMWLLSTSSKAKLEGIAEYFTDPSSFSKLPPGGEGGILKGTSVMEPNFIQQPPASPFDMSPTPPRGEQTDSDLADRVVEAFGPVGDVVADNMQADHGAAEQTEAAKAHQEQAQLDQAAERIQGAVAQDPELATVKDQLKVTQTPDGLRVDLLDREKSAMFASGSDQISGPARKLLEVVLAAVRELPQKLSIQGHTDARPFAAGARKDNWSLSSERANATRAALVEMGLPAERVREVVGKADREPLLPERPDDPSNRRISILLLRDQAKAAAPPR